MSSEAKIHPEAGEAKASAGSSSYNPLSRIQVKLRTNKKFKLIVAYTTLLGVFIDILGTALVQPVLPALCSYAENGPVDQIMKTDAPLAVREAMVKELINPDAFKDPKPPFKYSLSMNAVMSFAQFGSAGGSLLFGRLCDLIGCKIPMQICIFGGIIGYFIIYAAGKWVNSYWLFAFGLFWNNFFGNTMGIAACYMPKLFEEGPERDAMVGGVLGMGLVGGSIGSLIVMPFVTNPKNGENFFNAVWLAIGLTVFAFLLVSFILVPSPKETEKEKQEREEKANQKTPAMALRILIMTVIASGLDSAGDEGTRMARGTIISSVFPEWSTPERQNYLLLAVIGILIGALILLSTLKACFNLASIATIGCAATLATQCLLMVKWEAGPYIAIWHVGKLFGFLSTISSGFIIMEVAPPALLGQWNGRNDAVTNVLMAIAPLIFAPVYDGFGNKRGTEMLAVTASISFLATVAYMPIIRLLPKKKPKTEDSEEEKQALTQYEQLSDLDYSHLPLEILDKIQQKAMEEGKPPRLVSWGDYKIERPMLQGLQDRALKDFEYLNGSLIAMLTNREVLEAEKANYEKFKELTPKVDRDSAKNDMGAWIADYFDDAGYEGWETQTNIYKSMLLNAFPPIDALDDAKPDWSAMSLDLWEEHVTKFLSIMDNHIGTAKRRQQQLSANSLLGILRRR